MSKTLRIIALAAAVMAADVAPTAIAATANGNSTVTVVVPDVIVLDYFTNINLGLAGQGESHEHAAYSQTEIGGSDQTIDGSGALATGTLSDANTAALRGNDITLTLSNVWAVRGFSPTGKATVSVSGPSTLRKGATSSTITVSKLQVMENGSSASSAGTSISANLNGIQKVDATKGDVVMGLNFANTSDSGDYTGTITITAVTL